MLTLNVNASKNYDVFISDDSREKNLAPFLRGEKVAVITDENVNSLYGDEFIASLPRDKKIVRYVIKAGEDSKNADHYFSVLNRLAEEGFGRKDSVITLGGGVVGDLGAFVASTYMRGIGLVAVPTSLLAMVDSSVGGKTAINLSRGKNLCGTFYQPDAVFIDLSYLNTLPRREFQSGMGEIVKYSFLARDDENIDTSGNINAELIYNCLKIKARIVSADEREGGERKLLNLGHTVGHAIERLTEFSLPHGVCVAKGIKYALDVSRGVFGGDYTRFYERLTDAGFEIEERYDVKKLLGIMASDKKATGEEVDFVLIDQTGKPRIKRLSFVEVERYIDL